MGVIAQQVRALGRIAKRLAPRGTSPRQPV
jgi:hypothetical protein